MTDIMERLRALSVTVEDARAAADEIERLRGELAAEKQAHHYTGLAAHAEAQEVNRLNADLAASQAREANLREALHTRLLDNMSCLEADKRLARKYPTDDTALNARLAQERERCAKIVEEGKTMRTEYEGTIVVDWDSSEEAAEVLRNLGDE